MVQNRPKSSFSMEGQPDFCWILGGGRFFVPKIQGGGVSTFGTIYRREVQDLLGSAQPSLDQVFMLLTLCTQLCKKVLSA